MEGQIHEGVSVAVDVGVDVYMCCFVEVNGG